MKRATTVLLLTAALLFLLGGVAAQSQTLVKDWGLTGLGKGWPIMNTEATPDGEASMGSSTPLTAWTTMRGGFETLTATANQAMVVTGQLEYVGAGTGDSYVGIRYALTYQADPGELQYQYTDSAAWTNAGGNNGYEFTPRSGTTDMPNGGGGQGSVWTINSGNWNSTWSNNGGPLTVVQQVPFRASIIEGVYDFAISVQPLGNNMNEIRWYMFSEDQASYWFGGTTIDSVQVSTQFNGICFGIGDDLPEELTEFKVTGVTVELGDPIEVPDAPFSPFYVSQWGLTGLGKGWPMLNDSTTLVGDAGMGSSSPLTAWTTMRGGFGVPVKATMDEALIVSGQFEYVGAGTGDSYVGIRYALTYQADPGELQYQYTDSAAWENAGGNDGYEFTPRSGTTDMPNGGGGQGSVWTINNGNWNSTWSNNGGPLTVVEQAPFHSSIIEGVYDFAISVQPLGDGTNEIRWYMFSEDKQSYWFGGTTIDTAQTTTQFNGICFGIGDDLPAELTEFKVMAVHVDRGAPIEVPEAPFSPFYVANWGAIGRFGWSVFNDSTTLVGDASMGGEGTPEGNWGTIRGGFNGDVVATQTKAIRVTGQLELVGDGLTSWSPLRYGLFYHDSSGVLEYQYTDSARWDGSESYAHGYMFSPVTGTNGHASGQGGNGDIWAVNGGSWISTWSDGSVTMGTVDPAPARAEMTEGIYDFAMSVQPQPDGTNEVRWYIVKTDNSYWSGGTEIDTTASKTIYNGVCFGINNGNGMESTDLTGLNLMAVYVDRGDPITVPPAPFGAFYVSEWGFIGGRTGGWTLTPGELTGNVTISGDAAPSDWAAVRGGFDQVGTYTADEALVVTGKMELVDGGFEAWSSLRWGIFYSDSAGTVVDNAWTGTENHHTGYLFLPHSGTNDLTSWQGIGEMGTFGCVVDRPWISTNGANDYVLGTQTQNPEGAVGGAGTYDFAVSVADAGDGMQELRVTFMKEDGTYGWGGWALDDQMATDKFNSVCFALNSGVSTTAMNLTDVYVSRGDVIDLPDWVTPVEPREKAIPVEFALSQNYPNPFNPKTTINFALAENSKVKLTVTDVLGREVATLASGNYNAGYHTIVFNAENLPSGIYFYKLEAGDNVSVKKLMLMK